MKRISITINIDDEALKRAVVSKYMLVMRLLAPIPYVLVMLVIRMISQRTQLRKKASTPPKNAVYAAENRVFTQQDNSQYGHRKTRVGANVDTPNMHSSTMVKCGNPECKNPPFPYQKYGNQPKKFCSSACKDAVNNAKKMGTYYEK
jgi:hypothetical protein